MNRHVARWLGLAALASTIAVGGTTLRAQPATMGEWTGVLNWPIEAIHTVMLPTGKVMIWQTWTSSVGLWDPMTSSFSTITGAGREASVNPFCAGHAWLPDGRLLVVGGHEENYNGEEEANIFDPFTNSWDTFDSDPSPFITTWTSNVPDMNATNGISDANAGRWYPAAATLGTGEILALSGDMLVQGVTNPLPQVYDPATNTWRDLTTAIKDNLPEYPRTFLVPDGRVAVVSDYNNETWLLDTTGTGNWTYVDDTLDNDLHNYGPGVMYDAGKIAYLGGGNTPTENVTMIDFNEANPQWRYAGGGTVEPPTDSPFTMAEPRRQNNATILANGTVLITGGTSTTGWNEPAGRVRAAEIWDPQTEQVQPLALASDIFRGYHSTALLLPDGRVLVTGGNHDLPTYTENKNAEIYSPAYLFDANGSPAVRPTVTSAPDIAELGDSIFVETPDAESIVKAIWILPGAVTHAQNWTQRANILDFTAVEGGLNISLPDSANEAPPGYYMLFLVNDQGVPSVAEWIQATPNDSLTGDYNGNGTVDAADYVVWRKNLGTTYTQTHYDQWRANFGATAGSGSALRAPIHVAVPEPGALLLIAIAAMSFAPNRGWHVSRRGE